MLYEVSQRKGGKQMKSEWKVTSNLINNTKYYGVYRILDTRAVDHSGNRENYGEYVTDRGIAQEMADMLNGEETE